MSEVVKMCEKGVTTCCRMLAVMATLFCAVAALPSLADGNRRPMALMVMFDGLRADAIESGEMPNLAALRNGTWQPGYNAAWTVTGQNAPGTPPVSAPNHASIATGVSPSKHGVTANGKTASGNYAAYPTWLKRVVDAKSGTSALFVYSWSEDADLGPAAGVTFLGKTDAENATDLAALLASSDAPDATMYFIDAVDHAGHAGSYYPYTAGYRAALAESDGYLGACLSAIASRATFADEDWLILVTSDHGGFGTTHAERGGRHDHTIPIVISGRSVTAGRIPGCPHNFDVCASALAHFGVTAEGLEAVVRDGVAETVRPLSSGLAAYLPFDEDYANKVDGGPTATRQGMNVVTSGGVTTTNYAEVATSGGQIGGSMTFPSGCYVKLEGSQSLTFEGNDKSFAMVAWVKMGSQSGDSVIMANENWNSGGNSGALITARKGSLVQSGVIGVAANLGGGGSRIQLGTFNYETAADWVFYALTRNDDGVFTCYQGRTDGTLNWVSGEYAGFILKSGLPFCIAQDGTGNYGNKFVGSIDDAALWTRALRHDEVRRIYESGRAGTAIGGLLGAPAATAQWTGAGDVSDMVDPDNWSCADGDGVPLAGALPSWTTAVTISGETSFDLAGGKSIACKSIFLDNVTLSSDRDWSGLDVSKIANGSRIDLRGKCLTLKGFNGVNVAANVCTITDSTADTMNPGILEIDTPSGFTFENKAIVLAGNLRLKTIGTGTFIASKANQSYAGGTLVSAGTAKFGVTGSNKPFGAAKTTIEVASGANLDAYSRYTDTYDVTLHGGKFLNTRNPACGSLTHHIGNLTLTADSEIRFDTQTAASADKTLIDNAVWDLGGHTLTITFQGTDPDFDFAGTRSEGKGHLVLKNGTVKTVGSTGWWQEAITDGTQGGSYDISTAIRHQGAAISTVSNLTFRTPANRKNPVGANGAALHRVYGTFTPISPYFHNVEMLTGSTIDLSMKTGAWSTKCSNFDFKVTFATDAMVTVDLTGREAEMESLAKGEVEGNERGYVITWQSANKPTNVTFVPKMANAEKYVLTPTDTGLRIRKPKGLMIIVQ